MPIETSEIKVFRSALVSDATPAQNGGRMSSSELASAVMHALFPAVSQAERTAGADHWRKVFWAVRDAEDLALVNPQAFIEAATPGESYCLLYAGTQTDTEDEVAGRPYGFGVLASDADPDDTEITVTVESADYDGMSPNPYQVGDVVLIDARATVLDSGTYEYGEIASVSYAGATLTLGLVAGLASGYTAGARVVPVLEAADVAAAYSDKSVTGGVTFDDTSYPITVPSIGGVYQEWTVAVTDAATGALSVSGDTLGVVGTGSQGVDLSPNNPLTGTPYFTVPADGWGGTASNGDTLTFTTAPAALPLWYRRIIPAGAAAEAQDTLSVALVGESA